jgi:uncharacterized protein (TIGR02001 family)
MKTFKIALLAAAATVAMGGAAFAEDGPTFTVNIGAATDYVFRGVSQTDEGGQLSGGADVAYKQVYAGVWTSNVDFNNSTDLEYDLYAGVKPTLGPVALDLGVIYYGYTHQPANSNEDYVEFKAAGSVPVGKASVGAAVYYSNDFFGGTGNATYFEVNGSIPVIDKVSVSGALGYQGVKGPADYTTWNLGVGYALNSHIGFDLRYWDTDHHGFGDIYGSRVALAVKATF